VTPERLAPLLAVLLAACSKGAPLKVGLVTGLSGRYYDLGVSSRNGVELAVKEVNAAGGVNGRPIELIVRDDAQDPDTARRAVSELVQAGVVAIVGHATSSMAAATLPIVDSERVLMVSPTVSSSVFLGKDDWFVMIYPSSAESGKALAEHVSGHRLARRVALVYDLSNRVYTDAWHDAFKAAFVAAGSEVRSIPFTSGQVASMGQLAEEALSGGADGVLVVANALDTAALCQQVRLRSQVPIFGGEWGLTNDLIVSAGRAVEGARFITKTDLTDPAPRLAAFRAAYLERFGRQPDFAAVMGFEALELVAEGLRRAPTREGVRRAILGMKTFEGLQGRVEIDANGDGRRRHLVMTIRDGKVVPVR
jgi:branched-chain amino acid transport system substrate-binding protein